MYISHIHVYGDATLTNIKELKITEKLLKILYHISFVILSLSRLVISLLAEVTRPCNIDCP